MFDSSFQYWSVKYFEKLYGQIIISEQVAEEFGEELPEWILVREVSNENYIKILCQAVDLGEASTIALYFETENPIVILDDMKARKLAGNMNLTMTGTLGVVIKAFEKGIITDIPQILSKFQQQGFRIPGNIVAEILAKYK